MGNENDLTVEGKEVEQIFFPGEPLFVSRADYRLTNPTRQEINCVLSEVDFVENDRARPLTPFFVYAEDLLLEQSISIAPETILDIQVTFAFQPVQANVRFHYEVQITLKCGEKAYQAKSKLRIIQEFNKE